MNKDNALNVIILAAGKGDRMCSSIPKVLHTIGGKSMIQRLIDTIIALGISVNIYIVYSCENKLLRTKLCNQGIPLNWVLQSDLLGTGHAVQQVLPILSDLDDILILYGDVPLISSSTLRKLIAAKSADNITLLTAELNNPYGYGRIVRQDGKVISIVEHKDADAKQLSITEINSGVFIANVKNLRFWLTKICKNNVSHELYLTDIVSVAYTMGYTINTISPDRFIEIYGVNNKLQLVNLERLYQKEQAQRLLSSGVLLIDPDRFDLRGELSHGLDVSIDTNVIIEGKVLLGNRVIIGSGCIIKDSIIGDDVVIHPYSLIDGAELHGMSKIGPFSRLRPGCLLKNHVCVGNFVEIKKSKLNQNTKINHFSYIGDSDIGSRVNVGAGTVTCNYDGMNKHKTIVGNGVFIGSGAQLISPVIIEDHAYIGAGTIVTNNVKAKDIVISRVRQFSITKKRSKNKTKLGNK